MFVRDWMTAPAVSIDPKRSIAEAMLLMKEKRIRRLPVVRTGRLQGISTKFWRSRRAPGPTAWSSNLWRSGMP